MEYYLDPLSIDHFASWDSSRFDLYNCGYGNAHAFAVDYFLHSDGSIQNDYCQPPIPRILELLHFLLTHPCNIALCTTHLPSALLFPHVLQYSVFSLLLTAGPESISKSLSNEKISSSLAPFSSSRVSHHQRSPLGPCKRNYGDRALLRYILRATSAAVDVSGVPNNHLASVLSNVACSSHVWAPA